jgi:hypothetical protein
MPFGILRRKSPSGKGYWKDPKTGRYHREATLELKKRKGSRFADDAHVLRDTDRLFNSARAIVSKGRVDLEIDSSVSDYSDLLERGGAVRSRDLADKDGNMKEVYVNARPHQGMQRRVFHVIEMLMAKWLEHGT